MATVFGFRGVARNVKDLAYFMSVLAGPDERIPISIEQPGSLFARPLGGRSFKGVRVAMFVDMGLPWEPEVKETVRAQGRFSNRLAVRWKKQSPIFGDANECFLAWRHWTMESRFGDLIATKGDQLNEYVHWHVEEGGKTDRAVFIASGTEAIGAVSTSSRVHGQIRIFPAAAESSVEL